METLYQKKNILQLMKTTLNVVLAKPKISSKGGEKDDIRSKINQQ